MEIGGQVRQVDTSLMLVHVVAGHLQPVVVVETMEIQFLSIEQPVKVFVVAQGSGQGLVVVEHGFVIVNTMGGGVLITTTVTFVQVWACTVLGFLSLLRS